MSKTKVIRPEKGPMSRQPVLTLPRVMPDGTKTTKHPLIWLMDQRLPEDANKSTVARALGIAPQSLYKWEAACRRDRNFPIPVARARQIGEYFGVPPAILRPDIYGSV
jgi:hypothetical protein